MKKVLLVIIGIICSLSASALSYASPYKGAGRNRYIQTSAPMRSSMGAHSAMAQAPMAAMGYTGISMGRGITATSETAAAPQVRGIYTSASNIVGGVTSAETYASFGAPRKIGHPGECSHCIDEDNDFICDRCGMDIYECDEETCWCPLDFNWTVMLFFVLLAAAYMVYKKRTETI